MATMRQHLAANRIKAIVIVAIVFLCVALLITGLVLLQKLHQPRGPHLGPLPTLTLTLITNGSLSSSWAFSASFSDPRHLSNSLAFLPFFSYNNTTSHQLTKSIIGTPLLFHPNRRQSAFTGLLLLDLVRADVLPFFQSQVASGTIQAGVSVGTSLDDGRAVSWGCHTLLTTGYASLPIKCLPRQLSESD